MSYLPKLSEKAKHEIFKIIQSRTDIYQLSEAFYEAFRDLFDLEKYPITWEMFFEYCKKIKSDRVRIYPDSVSFIYYEEGERYCEFFNKDSSIEVIINFLNAWFNSYKANRMIIFGDIHGWWEQPQTY